MTYRLVTKRTTKKRENTRWVFDDHIFSN